LACLDLRGGGRPVPRPSLPTPASLRVASTVIGRHSALSPVCSPVCSQAGWSRSGSMVLMGSEGR